MRTRYDRERLWSRIGFQGTTKTGLMNVLAFQYPPDGGGDGGDDPPDPRKLKVKIARDGKEEEVEVALPDGYVDPDSLREHYVTRDFMTREVNRRLKGLKNPDELLTDEEFLSRVVTEKAEDLKKRLGVKDGGEGPNPEQVERIRESVRTQEVKPLREQVTALTGEIETLRQRVFRGDFATAASSAGVTDDSLEPLEALYRGRTKFSEEYGEYFLVDSQGEFVETTTPKAGKPPYRTIVEDLSEKRQAGKHPSWFKSDLPDGGGIDPKGKGVVVNNPWSVEHWNLTKQGEILRADRAKAKALAAQAGKTLPD